MKAAVGEQLVRRYYRAFFRGDVETVLSLFSPDICHQFNQRPPTRGSDQFREFIEMKRRHFRESLEDLTVLSEPTGTKVAAELLVTGNYLVTRPGLPEASNQPYLVRVGAFFDLRDDKIARLTTYFSIPEWLSQIGGDHS